MTRVRVSPRFGGADPNAFLESNGGCRLFAEQSATESPWLEDPGRSLCRAVTIDREYRCCDDWLNTAVAERLVGEAADDGVADDPVPTTPAAPVIGSIGRHSRMALCPVTCWPIQVRSRSFSRQKVVRSGVEKVGLATSRSFGWTV